MSQGGNVFQQSAGQMRGAAGQNNIAANLLSGTQGYRPARQAYAGARNPALNVGAMGGARAGVADPMMLNARGFGGAQASGYGAAQAGNAEDWQSYSIGDPNAIASGMNKYMNPYTGQVINRSIADIDRTTQMQQERNAADASAAGAFGGSRHGLVEAETNAEAGRTIGDLSAQLRSQAFDTAAGLSGQDINNRMQTRMANQQYANQARSENAMADNEFSLADQAAMNEARARNAQNRTDISLANRQMINEGKLANQGTNLAAALQNAQTATNVSMDNNRARNEGRLAQYQGGLATNLQNATQQQAASSANADRLNNASEFNRNLNLSRAQGLMGTSALSSSLGKDAFNMGNAISGQQATEGAQQQGLMQQLLNNAMQQFGNHTGQGSSLVDMINSTLGISPLNNNKTQTSNYQPGLFDYLGLGAGVASGKGGRQPQQVV